jgi:small subunit ribosomal protein S21
LQVLVRDNNVDQALRVMKKKLQREVIFREMRLRRFYEQPPTRATRERTEAIRHARKLAHKRAIRLGWIIDTRKKRVEPARTSRAASQRAP